MHHRCLAILLLLSACADSSTGETPPGATALLGGELADSPWPSDLFLSGGRLKVSGIPFAGKRSSVEALATALNELDGFPVSTSVFFPTTGEGLANGALEGTARLVDLTVGGEIALKLHHRASTGEVVALAPLGVSLREGHRYGCVLDNRWVRPSVEMREALAGSGPRAALYAPLVSRLQTDGIDPSSVGAATVFTVGHPTRRTFAMRAALEKTPLPKATVEAVFESGASLDGLLGAPDTSREGLGDSLGVVHDQMGHVILGRFEAPNYLSDSPAEIGRIRWDSEGQPIARSTSSVPFTLVLPHRPTQGYASTPVLIFQHGLNASMSQVIAVANDYARGGYATIGIDALWHGLRRPSHADVKHNFTGQSGPDGFPDDDPLGAMMLFFDVLGHPASGIEPFDGRLIRDNFRQAVLDISQLVRMVRQGDLSAIRAADPNLAELSFDTRHLVYTGESFGSILGAQVLAVEPGLQAGVLAVGGAGIATPIFSTSPYFMGISGTVLQRTLDPSLDFSRHAELPPEAQRSLSLVMAALGPGDPVAFAPHIVSGARPRSLLLLHANSDETMPNQAGDALAALVNATSARIPGKTRPPRFVTLRSAPLPITANESGATVVVVNLEPATHVMYTRFTDVRKFQTGVFPPTPLATPAAVDNPIELLHGLTLEFARSLDEDGVPTVRLPP